MLPLTDPVSNNCSQYFRQTSASGALSFQMPCVAVREFIFNFQNLMWSLPIVASWVPLHQSASNTGFREHLALASNLLFAQSTIAIVLSASRPILMMMFLFLLNLTIWTFPLCMPCTLATSSCVWLFQMM